MTSSGYFFCPTNSQKCNKSSLTGKTTSSVLEQMESGNKLNGLCIVWLWWLRHISQFIKFVSFKGPIWRAGTQKSTFFYKHWRSDIVVLVSRHPIAALLHQLGMGLKNQHSYKWTFLFDMCAPVYTGLWFWCVYEEYLLKQWTGCQLSVRRSRGVEPLPID